MARIQVLTLPEQVATNGAKYTPYIFVIDQAAEGEVMLPDVNLRAQFLSESGAKSVVIFSDTVDVANA